MSKDRSSDSYGAGNKASARKSLNYEIVFDNGSGVGGGTDDDYSEKYTVPAYSAYNGLSVKATYVSRDKYYNANDWYYAVGGYADRYETYTVNSITVYNDSVYDFLPLWTLKKSVKSFSTSESY